MFKKAQDTALRQQGIYSDTRKVATVAEHYFMSNNYIKPIANALREFDNFKHPLKNYEYFAWTGLHHYGTEAGYITKEELKKLADLSEVIHTDGNKNSCDE